MGPAIFYYHGTRVVGLYLGTLISLAEALVGLTIEPEVENSSALGQLSINQPY
jgi:hypothetical protein